MRSSSVLSLPPSVSIPWFPGPRTSRERPASSGARLLPKPLLSSSKSSGRNQKAKKPKKQKKAKKAKQTEKGQKSQKTEKGQKTKETRKPKKAKNRKKTKKP